MPFISVVLPAYNEELYLSACLESLSKQTLDPRLFEIIVVDNASTDRTAQIARLARRSFSGGRVKLISEPRKSVTLARQAGVNASRGQIIVSADADTIYPKNWLELIHKNFTKHPKLIALVGWIYYSGTSPWFNIINSLNQRANLWLGHVTGRFPLVFAANFAFQKSALVQIGGYPAHLPELGDQQYILFKLRKLGPIMINPRVYCHTSFRKTSLSYNTYRLTGYFVNSLFQKPIIGPTPALRPVPPLQKSHF